MAYKWLVLAGSITGAYGYVDAPAALDARFNGPTDCALSPDRSVLYVADYGNNAIRRVHLSGSFPVDTLCAAQQPVFLAVNPATGNLWTVTHDAGGNRVTRISPAGDATVVYTQPADWLEDVLPDATETYLRVKGYYGGAYFIRWRMISVAASADLGEAGGDGAYASPSGQMWSTRHPDVYVYVRDYDGLWGKGGTLLRHELYGATMQHDVGYAPAFQMMKIVPGPDLDPPHETFLAVNGAGWLGLVSFDADPAAPWMSSAPVELQAWGLPRLPAHALARDLTTGDLYFPTNTGHRRVNEGGISDYGVPTNAIVLATPADDLSVTYA